MVKKVFACDHCDNQGSVNIPGNSVQLSDIVYCPVCGSDISSEDDLETED